MATLLFTPSFSYVYDPHRDLHSFPTRRSSDLSPGRPGGGGHRSHGSNAVVLGTAGRAGNPMPGRTSGEDPSERNPEAEARSEGCRVDMGTAHGRPLS